MGRSRGRRGVVVFATIAMLAVGLGLGPGLAAPASAETPEEKFIRDLQHANAVVTSIPSTPDRWVKAGYGSCNRIQSMIAQGLPARAAINNEVIAATTFNAISRQNAVALVTYAVLDLCPGVVPPRENVPPIPNP
ncbi:MAG: hypothetical protein KIH64_001225 [Mycobacterium sp.]|nr:hypothetical protein [Mycobacterium sp.]